MREDVLEKIKSVLAALFCVVLVVCPTASAHQGNTDSSGGHYDNNNVSGLGFYHYHHGYSPHLHPNGICPYSSTYSRSSAFSSTTRIVNPTMPFTKTASATVTTNQSEKTVSYPGINFTLNDEYFIPLDAAGREVEAFVFNGTTYLPIRGIASALGLNVEFDMGNNQILLTSGGTVKRKEGTIDRDERTKIVTMVLVSRTIKLDGKVVKLINSQGGQTNLYSIAGTTYAPVRQIAEALGLDVMWDDGEKTIHMRTDDVRLYASLIKTVNASTSSKKSGSNSGVSETRLYTTAFTTSKTLPYYNTNATQWTGASALEKDEKSFSGMTFPVGKAVIIVVCSFLTIYCIVLPIVGGIINLIQANKEKKTFIETYAGKTINEIVKPPAGSAIGDDFLPCEPGKRNWGKYTAFVTPTGKCLHYENCPSLGINGCAINVVDKRIAFYSGCCRCNYKRPDISWYSEHFEVIRKYKEYNMKQYLLPSTDISPGTKRLK